MFQDFEDRDDEPKDINASKALPAYKERILDNLVRSIDRGCI